MKLKLVSYIDIDEKKWDECVLSSKNPVVFAQYYYLNATCENWQGLVLNDYEAVMPLTYGNKQYIKYLIQPPFTPQLGVFGKEKDAVLKLFMEYLIKNFKYINIELNSLNHNKYVSLKEKQTFAINYSEGFSFNENTTRNIKKAKKVGVKVEEVENFKMILKITNNLMIPWLVREIGIPKLHSLYFRELIKNSFSKGQLTVFKAYSEQEELISVGFFICNGKHAVYLKGVSIHKKDTSGSMHAIMAHAIEYFKDKAIWFDFGGGGIPGLANFYKGLGGEPLIYYILKVNNLPWPLSKLKK
ncbi:MAG: hypothetical protein JNM96_01975 [Bacteroidia bacterium]|nr:hypothetical protein [Bacteroidia bacterium]